MTHRDLSAFLTVDPKPMMHMFTPQLSIENVQFVVMISDNRCIELGRCRDQSGDLLGRLNGSPASVGRAIP
jgi:hypothetical protein